MKRIFCTACYYYEVDGLKRGKGAKRYCHRMKRKLTSPIRPYDCLIEIIPIEQVRQVLDEKEKENGNSKI